MTNFKSISNYKFQIIYLLISFFVYLALTTPVSAQGYSLGIYPPILEVMIKPNKTITQVYKITNNGSDILLKSSIVPFKPADELGNVSLQENSKLDHASWFSFLNANISLGDEFIIKAGQTQEIVLMIKVPENTPDQDVYATLLFESQSLPTLGESQTQNAIRMGSNLLVTVSESGNPNKIPEVQKFSPTKPWYDSFEEPQIILKLKNNGLSLFQPSGQIKIDGLNYHQTLLLAPQNVLAASTREIACIQDEKIVPCQLSNKFLVGKYHLTLTIKTDEGGKVWTTTSSFISFPFKMAAALLTTVAIVFMIKLRLKS